MGKKISIRVKIGTHNVPVRIDAEDEFLYRKAGKRLALLYDDYVKKYPDKAKEEIWMLAAYATMVENAQLVCRNTDSELALTVQKLNEEIHHMLTTTDE